jgi:hypothetical protein
VVVEHGQHLPADDLLGRGDELVGREAYELPRPRRHDERVVSGRLVEFAQVRVGIGDTIAEAKAESDSA